MAFIGNLNWERISESSGEVFYTFARSLEYLCLNSTVEYTVFRYNLADGINYYQTPAFGSYPRIWGITAIFTNKFLSLLLPQNFSGPNLIFGKDLQDLKQ